MNQVKSIDQKLNVDNSLNKQQNVQSLNQKAVGSIMQVTQIRKITQQTLSPVIRKIQQHISYLLQQSRILRNQTSTLQQVQSTNLSYKQQISTLRQQINKVRTQLIQINQKNLLKQQDNDKRFYHLDQCIQQLQRQGKDKSQKLTKLQQLNGTQTQLFTLTKQSIKQGMDILRQQISQFYDKNIKITHNNNQKFNKIQSQLLNHHKQLQNLISQVKNISNITAIYSSQRNDIKKHLQQCIQLTHHAIRRQQYENDKKYNRIQNQLLKTHIQKVVNQALTPQIRSFLPSLIHNLQLLKLIEKQINSCNQQINLSKSTQQLLSQKLLRFQYSTKKSIQEKQIEIKKLAMLLESKTSSITQQLNKNSQSSSLKIQQIQTILKQNKKQSDQMFQTFIQKNRTKIYLAVLQCKPPQVQQEQNRIKLKLQSYQLKMQQITKLTTQRSDNLLNIGNSIDSKLQLFQNRITKGKSDMKVQNDNMKRVIDQFQKKIQQSQHKNHQQSQIISKLLQLSILNTSLQIDQQYFYYNGKYGQQNNTHQSYISFHDGILYETYGDTKRNQTIYRKKKLNKEILKRTLLNQQAKLIDFITEKFTNWKWNDPKQRPSQFFIDNILPSYQIMMTDKKALIDARNPYQQKLSGLNYKMSSRNMIPQRKSRQSIGPGVSQQRIQPLASKHISKGVVQQKKFNNSSIDAGRGASLGQKISQSINHNSQLYTTIDFHKPNRIKLKKIDQQQQNLHTLRDKDNSKNRYSLNKQTIN